MNSCALCVYVYSVCFSLPYHKAYTLVIFYHLNELLFTSFCKNFHHVAVMKSVNDDVNNDNIDNTVTKFEGNPSIIAIKKQMKKYNKTFTFQNISTDKFTSIIRKLNTKETQNLMTYLLR